MINDLTILIADDHPIFRQGLKQIIEKETGFSVIAEAADGKIALDQIKNLLPAVAVLDLDMPEMNGFAIAAEVRKLNLPVKTIILTMHNEELHFNQAIDLGVSGFIIKDSAIHEIINCIKTVITGREYITPSLSSFLLNRRRADTDTKKSSVTADLTPTERRIMFLLTELKTSKDIAAELFISPRTVDNHRANICAKLNLQGSHALVKFAIQHKDELN